MIRESSRGGLLQQLLLQLLQLGFSHARGSPGLTSAVRMRRVCLRGERSYVRPNRRSFGDRATGRVQGSPCFRAQSQCETRHRRHNPSVPMIRTSTRRCHCTAVARQIEELPPADQRALLKVVDALLTAREAPSTARPAARELAAKTEARPFSRASVPARSPQRWCCTTLCSTRVHIDEKPDLLLLRRIPASADYAVPISSKDRYAVPRDALTHPPPPLRSIGHQVGVVCEHKEIKPGNRPHILNRVGFDDLVVGRHEYWKPVTSSTRDYAHVISRRCRIDASQRAIPSLKIPDPRYSIGVYSKHESLSAEAVTCSAKIHWFRPCARKARKELNVIIARPPRFDQLSLHHCYLSGLKNQWVMTSVRPDVEGRTPISYVPSTPFFEPRIVYNT